VLRSHTKSVNCVRFAPVGNALATAGDDHLIFVWRQHDDGGASVPQRVFGSDVIVHEKWIVRLTLRAHAGDVVDLAWSPTADLLVSCSLREELFVWNVAAGERGAALPIARLVGHQGNIKGVAWDPIGRYLASAGDDSTVRVWRVADWGQEAEIDAPFEGSPSNFYYRRLSWSPDGQMLACAGAVNSKMPVAAIIERGKWVSTRELVGHRQPVVVAAFNPTFFQLQSDADNDDDDRAPSKKRRSSASTKKKDASTIYAVCAIGSADSGLSIWTTHKQRSVMVATNVHVQSIVDLAWDRNTCDMLGCTSTDGTVSFFLFHDKDLDPRLPNEVLRDRLRTLYGDAADAGAVDALPEDPELMLENGADDSMHAASAATSAAQVAAVRALVSAPVAAVTRVVTEQSVSIVGGKRRIQPATLVSDVAESNVAAVRPTVTQLPSAASNSSFAQALATAPLVRTVAAAGAAAPVARPSIVVTPSAANGVAASSSAAAAAAAAAAKRKRAAINETAPAHELSNAAVSTASTAASAAQAFWLTSSSSSATSQRVVRQVSTGADERLLIDAEIVTASSGATSSTVQCMLGTQVQWTARLPQRVTHIAGATSWVALSCEDGTLLLRSNKGRMLVPALVLDAPVVALEASQRDYLLAVTADGGVAVWHVGRLERTVTSSVRALFATSARSVLDGAAALAPHLVGASIGDDGIPVVTLPTYESFVFHPSLQTWRRVVVRRHLRSEHASVLPLGRGDDAAVASTSSTTTAGAVVAELREQAKRSANVSAELVTAGRSLLAARSGPVFGSAGGVDEALAASIEHIEHRLATAMLLGPTSEQVRWVRIYARNAGNAGLQERLHELLAQLVGRPPTQLREEPSAERRAMWQLAREALAVIRPMRALQRLYTEFSDQLHLHEQQT
jgi:protein HIRA/HIR1